MRVALFATCVNDAVCPGTARAVVTLLERLGVTVDFPAAQTCCGQPQYNTGHRREAEPLLRRTARAFAGYDHVVTPSGSCTAMVCDGYPRIGARAQAEGRGTELADTATERGGREVRVRTELDQPDLFADRVRDRPRLVALWLPWLPFRRR